MRKKTQMWRDHIRKREQSGLSASAYCRKAKIKLSSFRYHKNQLLKISRNTHHESPDFLPIMVDSHPPKTLMINSALAAAAACLPRRKWGLEFR